MPKLDLGGILVAVAISLSPVAGATMVLSAVVFLLASAVEPISAQGTFATAERTLTKSNYAMYADELVCNPSKGSAGVSYSYPPYVSAYIHTELAVPAGECVNTPLVTQSTTLWPAGLDFNPESVDYLLTLTTGGHGVGPGATFSPPRRPDTQPGRPGPGLSSDTLVVCNPGASESRFDAFGVDPDGNRTADFQKINIDAYGCGDVSACALFGQPEGCTLQEPLGAEVYTTGSAPPVVGWKPNDDQEPTPVLSAQRQLHDARTWDQLPARCWLLESSEQFQCSAQLQNMGTSNKTITVTSYNRKGKKTNSTVVVVGPGASSQIACEPDTALCVDTDLAELGAFVRMEQTGTPRGDRSTIQYLDAFPLSLPATKKAVAFGAVAAPGSKVELVVLNGSDRKVKVKATFRRGDGSKLYGRKLKLKGHATGTLVYKKKARGNDTWVELQLKGKGSFYAWLRRTDSSGDVTTIPAWVLQ